MALKIRIVAVGDDKDVWVTEAISHYRKLLSRYAQLEIITVPPARGKTRSAEERQRIEREALLKHIDKEFTVALSDAGKQYTSEEFARLLERLQIESGGSVAFLIGGPYGLDDSIVQGAHYSVSLSPLTFNHQLVRPVLLEQLFRAFSILHGTDYHK